MKVVVIGCTHAGTAAILNTKRIYPDAEITVYERNDNISFLSCGIALYIGGVVEDVRGLFYSSPEELAKLNVTAKMRHDVVSVDIAAKKMTIRDIVSGNEFTDTYDKLIITVGSWPIVPSLAGVDLDNVLLCKNFHHARTIIEKAKTARKIAVVGAGYIGVELAEAFRESGKEVTLIDAADRMIARYLDAEFTDIAEKEFSDHGIKLALGQKVMGFAGDGRLEKVLTEKGEYDADLAVLCIGFRPNTALFDGQLDMLPCKAIKVDEYMRTSHPDVMAAGDCASIYDNSGRQTTYIPLATNAVRMGTLAALNLTENRFSHPGTQGTSGIKIYDVCFASTGLTVAAAVQAGIKAKSVTVSDNYRPEFMPSTEMVTLKVVYEEETERIVGAALCSKQDVTLAIDLLSLCIQQGLRVTDLAFADFFFQPHFNKPWNFMNLPGLKMLEKL